MVNDGEKGAIRARCEQDERGRTRVFIFLIFFITLNFEVQKRMLGSRRSADLGWNNKDESRAVGEEKNKAEHRQLKKR